MTADTCKIYYEQAKARGDAETMKFWKERAAKKGLTIEEPKENKPTSKKSSA